MKTGCIPLIFAALVLTACSEQTATKVEAVAVTSVGMQNREIAERLEAQNSAIEEKEFLEGQIAEKKRLVKLLQEPINRWSALYLQLPGKTAGEIGELISQMQALRVDIGAASTSACTEPKRDAVVSSMDAVGKLLDEFLAAKGETGADYPKRLGEAINAVQNHSTSLSSCT